MNLSAKKILSRGYATVSRQTFNEAFRAIFLQGNLTNLRSDRDWLLNIQRRALCLLAG